MTGLSSFTIDDLEVCSRELRVLGAGAVNMQESAQRVTEHLFDRLRGRASRSECALVSLHKTHQHRALPLDLHAVVRDVDPTVEDEDLCLVRMSMASDERVSGTLGSTTPLTATTSHAQPVVAAMLSAMGVQLGSLPDPISVIKSGIHRRSIDAFVVPAFRESELLTGAVRAELDSIGVQSAVGFGGWLPSGNLFMIFALGRVAIAERSARLLGSLAPSIRASLAPFTHRPFADRPA